MNLLDRSICFVSSLIFLILGLIGFLGSIGMFAIGDQPLARAVHSWIFTEGSGGVNMVAFTGNIILFGMGILLAGVAFRRSKPPNSILMETAEGEIEVHRQVLKDVVIRLKDQMDGIQEVDPILSDSGGEIHLVVEVVVDSSNDIPAHLESFKKRLRKTLDEEFNIKNLDRVTVRMKNISGSRSDKHQKISNPNNS